MLFQACGQKNTISIQAKFSANYSENERIETVNIINKRLSNFLSKKYSVEYDSSTQIISFKLPKINNTSIYTDLITSNGNIEFLETYDFETRKDKFIELNKFVMSRNNYGYTFCDTVKKYNMLFFKLIPNIQTNGKIGDGPIYGFAKAKDTTLISKVLNDTATLNFFNNELLFKWNFDPLNNLCRLICIKTINDYEPITNSMIEEVSIEKNDYGSYNIKILLFSQYQKTWSKLTKENIDKSLAIVLDNKVIAFPKVMAEITSGYTAISGNFDKEQSLMYESILKNGVVKTSLKIIK